MTESLILSPKYHIVDRSSPISLPAAREQASSAAEYAAHGLGPLKETATSTALYLDMLKRVLVNVVYHEQSHTVSLTRSIAEGRPDPVRADPAAFSLKDRALGEDVALNALSMVVMMGTGFVVGWRVNSSVPEFLAGVTLLLLAGVSALPCLHGGTLPVAAYVFG